MKYFYKIFIAAIFFISYLTVNAQVATNYSFAQAAGGITALTATYTQHTSGTTDYGTYPGIPIGFTFSFNCVDYTTVSISNDGWIAMGNTISNSYYPLSTGTSNNVIAALAADLQGLSTGSLRSKTSGTAPNRTFTVEWLHYEKYAGADDYSFQIILYETTNTIQIKYTSATTVAGNTFQVGLRGASSADYNNRTKPNATNWIASLAGTANTDVMSTGNNAARNPSGTFTWTFTGAICSGTPTAGTASASPATVCSGTPTTLTLTGGSTGCGISYQWQSAAAAAGPWTNIAGATTNPYSVSPTVATYYRCVVTCTATADVANSTSLEVTMENPSNCYCSSTFTNTTDEWITNVTFNTINNNSGQEGADSYGDYTSISTDVVQGSSYNIFVTFNSTYTQDVFVWFDWNNDGDFTDAGEEYQITDNISTPTTNSLLITIPFTSNIGSTRMRVMTYEFDDPESCETGTYGETEDYTINIIAAPPCSGTPTGGSTTFSTDPTCGAYGAITVSGSTAATGLTYQWYSSPTGGAPWTLIPGATNAEYTPSVYGLYYRRLITCTFSGGTAYSTVSAQYNSNAPINNECDNAISLTVNADYNCAVITSGTTYCATASAQANGCSGNADDDVWFSFVATSTGHRVSLTNIAGTSTDMYHSVYSGTCGSLTQINCSDADVSNIAGLTIGSTYYVRVFTYYTTVNATFDICVGTPPPPGPGEDCTTSIAFCTGDNYLYPASVDVDGYGSIGCLGSTPNPAWYFMQVSDAGDLIIDITSGDDVDFIAWGPYSSISGFCAEVPMEDCPSCPNNTTDSTFYPSGEIVDCSYDAAEFETVNILGAQPGEIYVLLITNYGNTETNIEFTQTSGAGTANCDIVAPPISSNSVVCVGETLELYVTYSQPGATYQWSGPGGWTSNLMEPTRPNATVAMSGTYTMVVTVGGITSDPVTTEVVVAPYFTPTFNAVGPYCPGDAIPALPTTSIEGVTGTWSPAINNTATTTYTFTPDPDQCANTTTLTITISGTITPTFTQLGPYCVGATATTFPTTSTNGIAGTWSPSVINTSAAGTTTYTFTPNAGICATTATMNIVINPNPVVSISPIAGTLCPSIGTQDITATITSPTASDYTYTWGGGLSLTGTPVTQSSTTSTVTATIPTACGSTYPVTLSVSDGNGCTASATPITIIVNDNTAPTIGGTIAVSNIEGCSVANAPTAVTTVAALEGMGLTISDNCTSDANLTVTSSDASTGTCPIVITRTYTVTDACGNSTTATHTINIDDNTAPIISGTITASNIEGCSVANAPAAVTTVAALEGLGLTISDNCTADANLTVTSSDASAGTCPIVITRTYTVTDACGNSTTATHTINIDDNTAPIISGTITASNIEGCSVANAPAAVTTVAALEGLGLTISDNCTADANLTVTSSDASAGTCPIVITRTYTVTDACGNSTTATHTINIDDNTIPTISGTIATSNIEGCSAANAPVAVTTAAALEGLGLTISDNCTADANLIVTSSDASTGSCPIVMTRTYTVRDACGNSQTATHTINIDDNTAPTLSGTPAAITYACAGDVPVAVTTSVLSTDNCAGVVSLDVADVTTAGTCPNNFTVTRTWTASDACGNESTSSQIITVNDNIAPTIGGTIAVTNVNGCSAANAPVAVTTVAALEALGLTISDNCTADANLIVTSSDASVGSCPIVITRTYTVTDACGNSTTATHTINIDDNTIPTISGTIATSNIEGCSAANAPVAVTTAAALEGLGLTISDNCTADANLTVTSSDASAGTCPIVITRTYTVTDACGNTKTATQTINIDDNTAPTIGGTISVSNIEGCSVANAPTAVTTVAALEGMGLTISDNCTSDANLTVTSSDASTGTCPIVITRTYTVTDACGNSTTATHTINIDDNTIPTISGTIATSNIEGCSAANAPVAVTTAAALEGLGLTISDNCTADANLIVTSSDASVGTCPIVITRTYTVTDACGNSTTATHTINIDDNTIPTISGTIATSNIEGCSVANAPTAVTTVAALEGMGLTISDNCTSDANLTVTSSDASTGTCPIVITRTYTVTDACGNTKTATQTINIDDNTAPTIGGTISASNIEGCSVANAPTAVTTVAALEGLGLTISDNCTADANLTVTSSDASAGTCPIVITRTYTVTDACGNSTTATHTINIDDNTIPTISGTIATSNIEGCSAANAPVAVTTAAALEGLGLTISDNCTADANLIVTSSDASTGSCPIVMTRTYTVRDACGNSTTATHTINVNQIDFTMPANGASTVACAAAITAPTLPTVNDACGNALTATGPVVSPTPACEGDVTYTYTYTDCAGHSHDWVYTYTIDIPMFTTVADGSQTVSCEADAVAPTTPTINDACGNTLTAVHVSTTSNIVDGSGTVTYIYSYTDCAGNTANWTFVYTVTPDGYTPVANGTANVNCVSEIIVPTLPVITVCGTTVSLTLQNEEDNIVSGCGSYIYTYGYQVNGTDYTWTYTYNVSPLDFTMPANGASTVACATAIVAPTLPTVNDACGNVLTASAPAVTPTPACDGDVTYTYTYTDCAGHSHDWVYTYTIQHDDFTMPANGASTVACATDITAPTLPTVNDACGNVLTASAPAVTPTPACDGDVTYTYTYTDCAGHSHDWVYTYTIQHDDFTMPANGASTVACATDITAPTLPTVNDACGNVLTASAPAVTPTPACDGDVTYTYTYTDCAGHSHNWVYTYTIQHDDFTMPANGASTVACATDITAPTLPTVNDACGNVLTASAPAVTPTPACDGDVTYTYTYTDCAGHSHNWVYTYTIQHDDFTMPANGASTVACAAAITAPTLPTVNDACGNALTATGPVVSPTPACEGDVTYTYTYTDCAGHSHDWVYTYTIDIPMFTMSADGSQTVSCEADAVAPTTPTINDACGNTLTAVHVSTTSNIVDGSGTVTYIYSYTDCAGNTANWTFVYTVTPDGYTPVANGTANVNCVSEIIVPTLPVITVCGTTVSLTLQNEEDNIVSGCGSYIYTYGYQVNGTDYTWTYTYNVSPLDFTMPANGASTVACATAIVAPTLPTVNDACGNVLTASAPAVTPTPACDGDVTYTYTYTDCAGHSHDWVYTYTIQHDDFTMPANGASTVACATDITAPTLPTVNDACGNVLTASAPAVTPTPACDGDVTYTYTYTDCAGHSHDWVYTYTIQHDDFTMPANGASTVACATDITAPTLPTVNDACGNVLTASAPAVTPTPACDGDVTYTYTYTDCAGHSHDWVYTYTIDIPMFTMSADGSQTVSCEADAVAPTTPTINDACGNTLTAVHVSTTSNIVDGSGTVTYIYSYTDCAGNTANWTFVYTVTPDGYTPVANGTANVNCVSEIIVPTLPVITVCGTTVSLTLQNEEDNIVSGCGSYIYTYGYQVNGTDYTWTYTYNVSPLDFTMPANGASTVACATAIVAPTLPTVNDACGNVLTASAPAVTPTPACDGDVTYTYTYTDCAGHSHDWVYTYTIQHDDFTMPANGASTVACAAAITAPTLPTVNDACGNVLTASAPAVTPTPACDGDVTYTYTYTDCAGHSHDWVYTYTIQHDDFTMPANGASTVACAAAITAPTLPTVNDACGNALTATGPVVSPTPACEGDVTYTYTYTDCAGHSHDWVYTYTIDIPMFTMSADGSQTVSCEADAVAPTTPTINDACGNTLTAVHVSTTSNIVDGSGTVTYIYSYTDCAGNTANWTFVYTVTPDGYTPVADGSANVHCVSEIIVPTLPTITVCGTTIALTLQNEEDNIISGCGSYIYTYGYQVNGTDYTWTYTYNVSPLDFTMPANGASTVACATAIVAPTLPTVNDACGNVLTASSPVVTPTPACDGDVTYTYTYTDCAGHSHDWVYTYTIQHDDFTMPANGASTVACATDITAPTLPTVNDACGNVLTASAPAVTPTPACDGDVTYTYTYTDCAGHSHDWVYTYTIQHDDFTMPANGASTVACATDITAPTLPTVNDACGNVLTASAPAVTPTPACDGDVTYTYTYTDCAGHSHDWVYTYTIQHDDFTMPANGASTVACAAAITAPTLPTVNDACGNALTATGPVVSPTPACEGDVTYTYTYTDCAGHSHDWVYTYTIDIPMFTMSADGSQTVSCEADAVAPTTPTINDACGNTLTAVHVSTTSNIVDGSGTVTYIYSYTDCAGNTANWTFVYTVTPDGYTPVANGTANVNCVSEIIVPTLPVITVCGTTVSLTLQNEEDNIVSGCGSYIYTYGYQVNGTDYTWTYTYNVSPLDFTMPANGASTVACATAIVAPTLPTVNDACGNVLTASAPAVTPTPACDGDVTYTYTYTDCAGHSHDWVYTYTIQHDDFTMPANGASTVACATDITAPTLPTVNDACGNVLTASAPAVTPTPACDGDVTYTYTYTDCAGHSHDWVYTYTIQHDDFTMPANGASTVACATDITAPTLPTVNDACGNVLTASAPAVTPTPACDGDVTYTYTYTDCAGHSHDWVYTYTIQHDDFTMPANGASTVACAAAITAPTLPTVNDACGNALTATGPVVSPTPACEGDVTYTYTYTDCAGHSHDWVYTYTIDIPMFTMSADGSQTVSCEADAVAPTTPTINDACGNTLTAVHVSTTSNIVDGSGTVTYIYSYTDCAGNTANWTFVYTVTPDGYTPVANGTANVNCVSEIIVPTLPVITVCGTTVSLTLQNEEDNIVSGCGSYIYTYGYQVNGTDYTWTYTYNVSPLDFTMPANGASTVACATAIVAPTLPTVNDACGNVLTASAPAVTPTPACDGTVTYTYTYTDCAGHSHDWVYTYTIQHDDFTMPANGGSTVACATDITAPTLPTVNDACGNVLTASAPAVTPTPACDGDVTYTYTYTDCAGHSHDWVYTYTIQHDDFTMPANGASTVACATDITAPTLPTVNDACGNVLTASAPAVTPTPACDGDVTYTYTYTDCAGHSHDWVYTYTIQHDDFTMPANGASTVACAAAITAPTLPTVNDACGNALTATGPVVSPTPACDGDVTYTYTYTDCAGHSHDWVYTYTIDIPMFTMSADGSQTVSCEADAVAPTTPTINDACGNTLTAVHVSTTSNIVDGSGTVTYIYSYTDCAGNTANWTFVYTVTPDGYTPVANGTANVNCVSEIIVPTLPVITVCGTTVSLTLQNEEDNIVSGCGSYIYTYGYQVNGTDYTWTYTYNVSPLDFTMPANGASTVACAADITAPTLPTVNDACGNVLTASSPVVTPTPACDGTVTYTYTYTDCAGHSHNWVYTYTIQHNDFTMPANGASTVACATDITAPTLPTVNDACGNVLTASSPVVTPTPACDGTVTYTYTYTDCAGHSHNWVYTYTIQHNDFTMPANGASTVACATDITAPTLPTVNDACGNVLTASAPAVTPTPTCDGDVTYTYTYTDCAGHSHDWVYTYTIQHDDFTMPANGASTVACAAAITAPTLPTVNDACGNALTATGPVVSPTPACEGDVTYTYTYTDCAGHSHDWVYTYTIDIPMFTMSADGSQTVSCEADAVAPTTPTINDACGNTLTAVHVSTTPNIIDGSGTVTYVYSYTDCAGNTANWTFVYTVTPDGYTPVADGSANVHCVSEIIVPTLPTITVCGTTIALTLQNEEDNIISGCGTYIYTYGYQVNGTDYTWTYTYNVSPLDFTMPSNGASTVACAADITAPTLPTVNDACGNVLTASAPAVTPTPACDGDVTYTYTYTDCAGHSHDWVYTYTISNTTNPIVNTAGFVNSSTVDCIDDIIEPIASMIPTATSTCGEILTAEIIGIVNTPNPLTCNGTRVYNYRYTDCSGLTNTWSYTYTLNDNIAPVIAPQNMDSQITAIACNFEVPNFVEDVRNISTDNCTSAVDLQITQNPIAGTVITATTTVTVTVTDACGNSSTKNIEVIVPTPLTISLSGGEEITCNLTTSSLTVTAENGIIPYSYLWDNGQNTATATGLNAGTHFVTVTDANGCNEIAQQIIAQDISVPIVGINPPATTELNCNVTNISLTATGGVDYSWSNGDAVANTTITTPGTYTVTATGANGCSATAQQIITQNITAPVAGINPPATTILTCATTSITLTATGGGTYLWSDGTTTANTTITTPGTYTVTVTSANGCTASANQTITQNITPPIAGINPPSSTILTCGTTSISLTATGGGTYLWSNSSTSANTTVNAPDTYTVTVTGANGCTALAQQSVTQNVVAPIAGITNNSGTVELTCNQTNISLTATGNGTYLWSNGLGSNPNVSILSPGTYTVTVTALNGCTATAQQVITQNIIPPTPAISTSPSTALTCTQTSISLTASGGATYSWNNSLGNTANATVTTPGIYVVTITATNGCTATAQQVITQNITAPIPSITASPSTEITCDVTNIILTASGIGVYAWNSGESTSSITIAMGGTYTVTVTGANGCTATSQEIITQNTTAPTAGINPPSTTILTCETTSIPLTATGGGTYSWSNGSNIANTAITAPGTYTVTVTASNGCSSTAQQTITQNIVTPVVGITNNTGTSVLTCETTEIELTASGNGTYLWSDGNTTATTTIWTPGTYSVTVTGANGCTASSQYNITQDIVLPQVSITNNTGTTLLTCIVTNISLTATGGESYLWDNQSASNTASISVNNPREYTVIATGTNGCTASTSITITETELLEAHYSATAISCHGDTSTITVTASGGLLPYSGIGQFTAPAGSYQYTVTDAGGCVSTTQPIVITQPDALQATYQISSKVICNGETATVYLDALGGTTPYSGIGLQQVYAGNHSFEITDANGCKDSVSFYISEPTAIIANITQTEVIKCHGAPQGALMVTATGGYGNFSYLWNDNNSTDSTVVENLTAGSYTVTITDFEGCEVIETAIIEEPLPIVADVSVQDVSCFGGNDGLVNFIASGGTEPYSYSFVGKGVNSNFISQRNLVTGEYTLYITDRYSCSYDTIIFVSQPAELVLILNPNNPTCIEGKNGYVEIEVHGGTEPYEYFLNDISYKDNARIGGLEKGSYLITVIDSAGCESAETPVLLYDTEKNCLDIPDAITPNGDGRNDTWMLDGINDFSDYEVCIFNRWGQQLFKSDDYEPWDGTYKGKKVPTGTYLYVILIYGQKKYAGTLNVIY